MSKKVVIPSINLRSILGDLFKSFIERVGYDYGQQYDMRRFWEAYGEYYDDYDGYGDDYGYADYYDSDMYYGVNGKKSHKHHVKKGHKSHKGSARIIDINEPYSGEEDMLEEDRVIYYYPDYHERDSRFEFHTYSEFQEFCESMGYDIPSDVESWIRYNTVCHCCLSSESLKYGKHEIVAESSYGILFYDVCDIDEL